MGEEEGKREGCEEGKMGDGSGGREKWGRVIREALGRESGKRTEKK